MLKKLISRIKCFFGKHEWVDAYPFNIQYCKHCDEQGKTVLFNRVSLTGFSALRKDK